jgi:hypothetical protein
VGRMLTLQYLSSGQRFTDLNLQITVMVWTAP